MSKQQQARDALRTAWVELFRVSLPLALASAQTEAAADTVVAAVWPAMRPDDMILIDRADRNFLLRGDTMPVGFLTDLQSELVSRAEATLHPSCPVNRHARGGGLRDLVRAEVENRKGAIRDATERLFEAKETDRFCSPADVRDRVLSRLSDLILEELQRLDGADESETNRKLKILTALTTPGGDRGERDARLRGIRDGSTASFPYVLKYLNRGICPSVRTFPAGEGISYLGFRDALVARFPEAAHVRICLERYQQRQGVISRFIPPEGPVAPGLEELYASKPSFLSRPGSDLLLPKSVALNEYRRDFLRIPDGVVCAVSLGVLLESVLRQVVVALDLGGGPNVRGGDMLRKVASAIRLRERTVDLLTIVFDQNSLNLRDAMAHGAFFAGDLVRLESALAGLSQSLHHLGEDLSAAGVEAKVFAAARWDEGRILDPAVSATLVKEYQSEQNLTISLLSQGRFSWMRGWQMIKALIPDKLDMGQAASLLWVSGQEDAKLGRGDDTHHFAAIFAGLVVLEELFRGVYEVHGRRVLRVTKENPDRVRCELAILEKRPGNLLEPAALQAVFGIADDQEPFWQTLEAVRAVRDAVLHGAWRALNDDLQLYHHLILKVIYKLCDTVGIAPPSDSTLSSEG